MYTCAERKQKKPVYKFSTTFLKKTMENVHRLFVWFKSLSIFFWHWPLKINTSTYIFCFTKNKENTQTSKKILYLVNSFICEDEKL